jgi:beta-glucosidase
MGAHRLSVEWGRVEPVEGRFDGAVLDRYREEARALRAAGIEPMVTLHHFSFPTWLARRGGVLARDLPVRFEAFARRVASALADDVRLFITINEPNVLIANGYVLGIWPPGVVAPRAVPPAIANLRRAHARAYRAIHETKPTASVGLAHHVRLATAATSRLLDRAAARLLDTMFNRLFLDLPQDFIGINYYTRDVVRFALAKANEMFAERSVEEGSPLSDLGWEIHPSGLGVVLRDLGRRKKPIYITENGIADAKDAKRAAFITDHLREALCAIDLGIDVRGYLHWSLLDNFEWAEGYAPRFGLYAVDFSSQVRTLRPSGELYGRMAKDRRLEG